MQGSKRDVERLDRRAAACAPTRIAVALPPQTPFGDSWRGVKTPRARRPFPCGNARNTARSVEKHSTAVSAALTTRARVKNLESRPTSREVRAANSPPSVSPATPFAERRLAAFKLDAKSVSSSLPDATKRAAAASTSATALASPGRGVERSRAMRSIAARPTRRDLRNSQHRAPACPAAWITREPASTREPSSPPSRHPSRGATREASQLKISGDGKDDRGTLSRAPPPRRTRVQTQSRTPPSPIGRAPRRPRKTARRRPIDARSPPPRRERPSWVTLRDARREERDGLAISHPPAASAPARAESSISGPAACANPRETRRPGDPSTRRRRSATKRPTRPTRHHPARATELQEIVPRAGRRGGRRGRTRAAFASAKTRREFFDVFSGVVTGATCVDVDSGAWSCAVARGTETSFVVVERRPGCRRRSRALAETTRECSA